MVDFSLQKNVSKQNKEETENALLHEALILIQQSNNLLQQAEQSRKEDLKKLQIELAQIKKLIKMLPRKKIGIIASLKKKLKPPKKVLKT